MVLSYLKYIYSENNSKISRFLVESCRRHFGLIRVKLGEKKTESICPNELGIQCGGR